jgi:hypothetical protein
MLRTGDKASFSRDFDKELALLQKELQKYQEA